MQSQSGFIGKLSVITDWIMRLSVTNILWMIVNIPIIAILLLMIFSPEMTVIAVLAIPVLVLLPFLFFPGTIALFAISRDWLMKKQESSLLKTFLSHFKRNYKHSVSTGIIFTCIWAIWAIDLYFFHQQAELLGIIIAMIGLILYVYTIVFLCMSVHYQMGKKQLFKNAFFITFGRPSLLLTILMTQMVLVYLSARFWFLLPFFTISVSIFLSFFIFYRTTLKINKILS